MAIKDLINGNHTSEIALNDRAVHYGDGLFETIAIQNKKILCFDEHLNRLEKGCKRLKIPITLIIGEKDKKNNTLAINLINGDE